MKDISDRFVTVMGILVGLAVAPVVFLCTFPWISTYMPWLRATEHPLPIHLTFWLPIVLSIAWSVFAAIGWKHGNVGIRIGLTLVIWAFTVAVVLTAVVSVVMWAY